MTAAFEFLADLGWPSWLIFGISAPLVPAALFGALAAAFTSYTLMLISWEKACQRTRRLSRKARRKRHQTRLVYSAGPEWYIRALTAHRFVRRFVPAALFQRSGARAASAKAMQRQGLATLESREALSAADEASGLPGQGEAQEPRKLLAMNPNPATAPNPVHVRAYFDAGLPLFPLNNWNARRRNPRTGAQEHAGKTPLLRDWRIGTPAVEKPEHITDRMARGGNAGVRLPSDWIVIDRDPRNGATDEVWRRFCADFSIDEKNCPRVESGRGDGGYHLYFRNPQRLRIRKGLADYPGIDFLSEGRYVVAAGSLHPDTGREYQLRGSVSFKEAPAAPAGLFAAVEAKSPAGSDQSEDFGAHSIDGIAGMLAPLDPVTFAAEDRWFALMCSVHFLSGGLAEDEFVEWSRRDPQYDTDTNEQSIRLRWRSLSTAAEHKAINRHELFRALQEAGEAHLIPLPKVGEKFSQILSDAEISEFRATVDNDNAPPLTANDPDALSALGAFSLDQFGERYMPPEPLLDGVIGRGTVTVLSGDPGSGKTFWAIGLAGAVASGASEFCGTPVRFNGRVLYAALEGQGVIANRFLAYQQQHGRSVGANLRLMGEGVSLRPEDEESRKRLTEVCRLYRPALVVLDTLSMAVAGADTDKEKDMAPALKTANAIATHTGAAVIVIHHPPKAGGSSVRGSGTIIGNVDAVFLFARDKDAGLSTLEAVKLRWGAEPAPLAYRLQSVSLHARNGGPDFETDAHGNVISSAVLVGAEAPSLLPKPSLYSLCANALGFGNAKPDSAGVLRRPLSDMKDRWCERLKIRKTALHELVNAELPLGEDNAVSFEGFKLWREEKVRFAEARGPGSTAICGRIVSEDCAYTLEAAMQTPA